MLFLQTLIKALSPVKKRSRKTYVTKNKRCPICTSNLVGWTESRWNFDEAGKRTYHTLVLMATCSTCQRLTVDDAYIPDNDNEPMEVAPYIPDWVKCPHCNWRFSLSDSRWSGGEFIHSRCGQRLIIID